LEVKVDKQNADERHGEPVDRFALSYRAFLTQSRLDDVAVIASSLSVWLGYYGRVKTSLIAFQMTASCQALCGPEAF
jgi:hypothetical protein